MTMTQFSEDVLALFEITKTESTDTDLGKESRRALLVMIGTIK